MIRPRPFGITGLRPDPLSSEHGQEREPFRGFRAGDGGEDQQRLQPIRIEHDLAAQVQRADDRVQEPLHRRVPKPDVVVAPAAAELLARLLQRRGEPGDGGTPLPRSPINARAGPASASISPSGPRSGQGCRRDGPTPASGPG